MSSIELILLGFVQGITEFLPISSSGHLLISRKFFNVQHYGLLLEVALHVGTLFSILIFWRGDYFEEIKKISLKKNNLFLKVIVGTIPAGILGLLYKNNLNDLFFDINSIKYLIYSYSFMTLLLFSSKYFFNNVNKRISIKNAFLIGIAQSFAMIPGISRSGLTIIVALFLGIEFKQAMKFSFMLAIPILIFAGLDSIINNFDLLISNSHLLQSLFFGVLSSAFSGLLVLFVLNKIIKENKYWYFSFYCLLVSIMLIIFNYGY